MTLETGVKALAEAVAVDVKALEDSKVDKVAGKGLSETNFTELEKTKLADIASEATKNRADSLNADKLHTHTTAQVVGLDVALENKVDKSLGKGLSDTNFTQAEKNKLSSLEGSKFVGLFVSESALPTSGSEGDYANVDGGVGNDVYRVIWDSSDNKWVKVQGVSTNLTPSQIKQEYESNPDTNAFTDDEKAKLTNVANNATANIDDNLNADKVHTHTIAQVDGLDASLSGKASNADPRFTDAREWTATTISQAEAEAGTAITRRVFTAQRVRQAIVAWFNGISGALGRTILTRTTAAQVRSDIELGTAATKDVGESTDNVMEVGAFGLGRRMSDGDLIDLNNLDMNNLPDNVNTAGFHGHFSGQPAANAPRSGAYAYLFLKEAKGRNYQIAMLRSSNRYYMRTDQNSWDELHHTGNILKTTGTSTTFPMSQKAATDALNTKRDATDTSFPRYDLGSVSATDVLNLATSQVFRISATSNRTISFSNAPGSGRAMTVVVHLYDASLSSRTITWPSNVNWAGGQAPTLDGTKATVVLLWTGNEWIGTLGVLS